MPATDHASTLAALVLEQPRAVALFERLGLDYCCGGRRTLDEACSRQGLDATTVGVLRRALADEPGDAGFDPSPLVHEENNALFPRARARIAA